MCEYCSILETIVMNANMGTNGLNLAVKLLTKIILTVIFKLSDQVLYLSKYIFVFRLKYL